MGTFLVVVIALGWLFSVVWQSQTILYVAVIFAVLTNFFSYWYSDKLVITMTGARPARREEFFDLYTMVENLSITAGLPMPKVYVVNDPSPNAFATGRDEKHAVVAVTTGLLRVLNRTELEGVIAHELSHIGNRDMLVATVAVVLAGFVAILGDMFIRSRFLPSSDREGGRVGGALAVVALLAAILAPLGATLIRLAISRRREFLADASGALLTRYPEGLASALQKISQNGQPMRRVSGATAHLFIANPFGPRASALSALFMTHPPVEKRIAALLGLR